MKLPIAIRLVAVPFLGIALLAGGAMLSRAADEKKAGEKPKATTKMSNEELKKKLTPLQYKVTREHGTEPPFRNEYWDNHEPGIYVDVITGKPLFASLHKFESGTGWPSFWQPIDKNEIVEVQDNALFMKRVEVRSKSSDSHLGHVFDDGRDEQTRKPTPTGMRYCMNSAAMKFIHKDKMKAEGYGDLLRLFEEKKK